MLCMKIHMKIKISYVYLFICRNKFAQITKKKVSMRMSYPHSLCRPQSTATKSALREKQFFRR